MSNQRHGAALRLTLLLVVLALLGGCINLPPALERELACPAADAPDNFGSAQSCARAR